MHIVTGSDGLFQKAQQSVRTYTKALKIHEGNETGNCGSSGSVWIFIVIVACAVANFDSNVFLLTFSFLTSSSASLSHCSAMLSSAFKESIELCRDACQGRNTKSKHFV